MSADNCDVLILGGGMVGLSIANQLLERDITSNITILDKEPELGLHSSGRNSGVLHAGLYYKPGSLKARVCVEGARRLRSWVEERGLPLNPCGKVIVPPRGELDSQLDVLAEREIAMVPKWSCGTPTNCGRWSRKHEQPAVEPCGAPTQPL